MSNNGQELLKIETCALKVHINCQGCKKKVKKLLRKIEGVFSVKVDAENQVVIVSGTVEPATLIKKLVKSGKYAELYSPSFNETNFPANFDWNKNQRQCLINGLNTLKPIDYGVQATDDWSMETYLNHNIGTKAVPVTGQVQQNFTTAAMEDDISAMMGQASFRSSDAGYFGFGGHRFPGFQDFSPKMLDYDYNHLQSMMNDKQQGNNFNEHSTWTPAYDYAYLPPMMMNNLQQGYQHYNHPLEMMNIYMHNTDTKNNMILNGNVSMYQPHYGCSYEPKPYY